MKKNSLNTIYSLITILVFIFSFLSISKLNLIYSSPVYKKIVLLNPETKRASESKISSFQEAYNSVYNKEQDKKYAKIVEEAKSWWVKELGYTPWTSPVKILWSSELDNNVLGLTTTPGEYTSLQELEWGSYIQIDNEKIMSLYGKEDYDKQLKKVLTHEIGHYLGLNHTKEGSGPNMMDAYTENIKYTLNQEQKNEINQLK